MKAILISSVFLALSFQISDASVLSNLAGSMSPGEWRELQTTGLSKSFLETRGYNHANFPITQYAAKAQWDPESRQFMFLGSPHENPYKFIIYSEETNSWREGPLPRACMAVAGCDIHSYYNSSIDYWTNDTLFGNKYYFWSSKTVYQYNIKLDRWSQTTFPMPSSLLYGGLAYIPEQKTYVYASGERGLWKYNTAQRNWSEVSGYSSNTYHVFSLYNPVHRITLFGGGNGDTRIWSMDHTGTVKSLGNAPGPLGTSNGLITHDPASGRFLLYSENGTFYEYDINSNNWSSLSSPPSAISSSIPPHLGVVAAPVPTYGVVMFLTYEPTKVYLYKHANMPVRIENVRPAASHAGRMALFPNPAVSGSVLKMTFPFTRVQLVSLSVFDVSGRLIQVIDKHGPLMEWNTDNLKQGIYVLNAKIGNRRYSEKLVIQK